MSAGSSDESPKDMVLGASISRESPDEGRERESSHPAADEAQSATRALRDIAALSTLPAIWSGAEPLRIAESLAAALFTTLNPEFVYIAFADGNGRPPIAVAQTDHYEVSPVIAEKFGPAIWDWARTRDLDETLLLADPRAPGVLQVRTRPLGREAELGVVAAGFVEDAAPTWLHEVMLNVGASQAVGAFRNAQLLHSLRESEERIRRVNAELSQRLAELQKVTNEIQDSRRAALNIMEDAVQSRRRAEILNLQLRDEIAERKRAQQAREQLASIVETSHDAIISTDLDAIVTSWNKGAEDLYGYSAEQMIGKSVTILISEDRHNEEPAILQRVRRGERVDPYETVRRRKDGSFVDVSLTVSPVKDGQGTIVGASKIARDISDRRRAQELQVLLLREMSHRVKNLFAVTSGMVALSARSASTPAEMAEAVQGRLGALTRAHELTRPGLIDSPAQAGKDTSLHALLQQIVAPYADRESSVDRVIMNGPDVPIAGNATTSVALILHEFTTNAAKYGALSVPTGCIQIDSAADDGQLLLVWRERGGPSVATEPDDEGFGTVLTRGIVVNQFGGQLSRDWQPDGLIVRLSVPLDRLTV